MRVLPNKTTRNIGKGFYSLKGNGMVLTKTQELIYRGLVCPYCKQPSEYVHSSYVYVGSDYGMMYRCKPCRAWVGTHKKKPKEALGRLADRDLRKAKMSAHEMFDRIWPRYMTRQEAYQWLSEKLNIPKEYTHIGMFSIETCKKVVEISEKYLKEKWTSN